MHRLFYSLFLRNEHKPHVLYDYQAFQMQRFGGISRYFCEIIRRLHLSYDIAIRYTINYYLTTWNLGKHRVPIFRFLYKHYGEWCKHKNYRLSIRSLREQPNYVFHPTYYDPYFLKYIGEAPYVITVHDMIHERFADWIPDAERYIREKKEVITRASRIIAISENTKKDIVELLHIAPEKIDVIYHSTSMKPHTGRFNLKLPEHFVLYVGERSLYKNFWRFMKAFVKLREVYPDLYVVCTGRRFDAQERAAIEELGLGECLLCLKASDKELGELYARALCFVYPSLYEGFGIPILEAYACQCPVVLSNTSCFPEIAGEAGCYFDPYSEDSMFEAIRSVLDSPQKREELVRLGNERLKLFSWDKAAEATEAVYRKVLEEYQRK